MGILDLGEMYFSNGNQRVGQIELFDTSQFTVKVGRDWSTRNYRMYALISHKGLLKNRTITSTSFEIFRSKLTMQLLEWDLAWRNVVQKQQEKLGNAKARQLAREDKEAKKQEAASRTLEARKQQETLKGILAHTLSTNDAIDWNSLKHRYSFQTKPPEIRAIPVPSLRQLPREPRPNDQQFTPTLNILDHLLQSRRQKKIELAKASFETAHRQWQDNTTTVERANQIAQEAHARDCGAAEGELSLSLAAWEQEKKEFFEKQAAFNAEIDARRKEYEEKKPEAIRDYCDMVLMNSSYPECIPKEWDLEFSGENGMFVVDYRLPAFGDLPNLKEVKYLSSKDEFSETYITEIELSRVYDNLIYQIALRTIHELFEADVVQAISAVVFNGLVRTIDSSTGQNISPYIISVLAKREEFLAINLESIDPKACFKKLKGVGSSKLS